MKDGLAAPLPSLKPAVRPLKLADLIHLHNKWVGFVHEQPVRHCIRPIPFLTCRESDTVWQDAEKVRQPVLFIWSVSSVWSVSIIWLNQTNQRDQINQMNQRDQMDQTDRVCPRRAGH